MKLDYMLIRPNIGASTDEPNLYKIVYNYYREHFDTKQSNIYAHDYFVALWKRVKEK